MNADLRFYVAILWRRLPLFLVVFLSVAGVGVGAAVLLPTMYRANATLLIEDPQIAGGLLRPTVQQNENEQLQILQRRIQTRSTLLEIARRFQVFDDMSSMTADEIVIQMRENTSLRATSGRNRAAILELSFLAEDPSVAAEVVNEYVTRILSDNARERLRMAGDTMSFFEQEVERLGTELDIQSARILEFQNENISSLPSNVALQAERRDRLQRRVIEGRRELISLEENKKQLMKVFLAQQSGAPLSSSESGALTPTQRRLAALEEELTKVLSVYSENSPRAQMVIRQIDALREQLETASASAVLESTEVLGENGSETGVADALPTDFSQIDDLPVTLEVQVAQIDLRMTFLTEDIEAAQVELDSIIANAENAPTVSIALEGLERDYINVQEQYNAAVDRLAAAVTGERIEALAKGQRFSVLEQATAPTEPDSPNRKLIAATGLGGGFGAALSLILLLEFLNQSIRRPVDLANGLGITPLVTIPYIPTRGETLRKRVLSWGIAAVVILGLVGGTYYVHTEVMHLEQVMEKAMSRLGS